MAKQDYKEFIDFLESNYDVRSYSGRGMYGKSCIGIECSNVVEMAQEIGYSIGESMSEMGGMPRAEFDSMGMEYILYWPRVEYSEGDTDDDDCEESEELEEN